MKLIELLPKISPDNYVVVVDYRTRKIIMCGYVDIENFTDSDLYTVDKISIYDDFVLSIYVTHVDFHSIL